MDQNLRWPDRLPSLSNKLQQRQRSGTSVHAFTRRTYMLFLVLWTIQTRLWSSPQVFGWGRWGDFSWASFSWSRSKPPVCVGEPRTRRGPNPSQPRLRGTVCVLIMHAHTGTYLALLWFIVSSTATQKFLQAAMLQDEAMMEEIPSWYQQLLLVKSRNVFFSKAHCSVLTPN